MPAQEPRNTRLIAALTAVPILTLALLRVRTSSTFFDLIRDPSAAMGSPPYIGFLSQVGAFYWISAAAICLFSSHLLRGIAKAQRHHKFLLLAGLFTLALAIDDVFLLHDYLFPKVLGIAEKPVLAAYGAFLIWLLVEFRSVIRSSSRPLLIVSIASFGLSLLIDYLNHASETRILIEDGLKLLGIICWMTFLADLASTSASFFLQSEPSKERIGSASLSRLRIWRARSPADAETAGWPAE